LKRLLNLITADAASPRFDLLPLALDS